MSTNAPPKTPIKFGSGRSQGPAAEHEASWFEALGPRVRKAFKAAFAGYVLAIVALRFLPETHGKSLAAVE